MRPRSSSACSTMPASASWSGSNCPNTPTRSGTATCRMRGPARSTATACTAPTSRRPATASTRTSCCSTPMPRRHRRRADLGPGAVRLPAGDRRRPDLRRARQRAPHAALPGDRPRLHLGPRAQPRGAVGADDLLRDPCEGLHQAASRPCPRRCAAPMPASASAEVVDYLRGLGVTSVELLPIHTFVNDSHAAGQGADQLLGLQHDRLLRPGPALRRNRPSPSPSSRRWWRGCTMPASR